MEKLTFRKIYTKTDDIGCYVDAIIIFNKREYAYEVVRLTGQAAEREGCDIMKINKKYKYNLQIDLWFIIIRLDWQDK